MKNLLRSPGLAPVAGTPVPEALSGDVFERLATDVGDLWISTQDIVMRRYIRSRGTLENELGRAIRAALFPRARFLDVGANVGYFSVAAHRYSSGVDVTAIEPHPEYCAALRMNLWINGCTARVISAAATSRRGAVTLVVAANNLGDTRVEDAEGAGLRAELVVPSGPLDELLPGSAFDVVKIDVQGGEIDVLAGMQGIAARSPGIVVFLEFTPLMLHDRGLDAREALSLIRGQGWAVALLLGDAVRRADDDEILQICASAGAEGSLALRLTR